MLAKEFDESLRSIVQMNYGLVLISHATDKTFTDENGQEFNQIVPTLQSKARNIVNRIADIVGYSRVVTDEKGNLSTKLFMRGTPRYIAGSRFKYTPDYIDFNYKSLVDAIGDAVDKQAEEDGAEYFTSNAGKNLYQNTTDLDFDKLTNEFNSIVNKLIEDDEEKFNSFYAPRITQITDTYLGKGNKVNNCSRDQVEALDLIVADLKDLISNS